MIFTRARPICRCPSRSAPRPIGSCQRGDHRFCAAVTDLKVAVLGVGLMGAFHVDALTKRIRGAEVTVINDFFAEKAQQVASQVGARVVGDPIAAIQDPEIDAVLLATPGAAHAEQVNACLDRGIPVLCEKPLTTDVPSAYALVQKEKSLGRQLIQVGFMRRFDAGVCGSEELDYVRRAESADGALHPSQCSGRGSLHSASS